MTAGPPTTSPRVAGSPVAAVLTVLAALTLASCSSSSPSSDSVKLGRSPLGAILVSGDGRALYLYGRDTPGRSACSGACTRVWPPATVSGSPSAGPGVAVAKLGEIRRPDQRLQLTYDQHPLYTFSGDTAGGQTGGEGFLGTWFLVSPLGGRIVDPRAAPAAAGY